MCTKQGFGLQDTRNLFVDDFNAYYAEIIYVLESEGNIKEGTYDKMMNIDRSSDALASLVQAFNKSKK